ncbi:MAG: hypothetical protein ACP5KK_00730 [Candidatus Nanoarchaeia archaeon]
MSKQSLKEKSLKEAAKKELARMKEVFSKLHVEDKNLAKEFYIFAKSYFDGGLWLFEKKKYLEAFESAIIAWSYIDAGLKLNFFKVPEELSKYFTFSTK